MALGSNRDYVKRRRLTQANLNVHYNKKLELMVHEGLPEVIASERAFNMITNGELKEEIKAEVKRLTEKQNGR